MKNTLVNKCTFEGYLWSANLGVYVKGSPEPRPSEGKIYQAGVDGKIIEIGRVEKTDFMTGAKSYEMVSTVLENARISGDIVIATDEKGLSLIPIHYGYVVPTFGKSGKDNSSYYVLQDILNRHATVAWSEANDKEKALKLRATPNLTANEYWSTRNNNFSSMMRLEGGFIQLMNSNVRVVEDGAFKNLVFGDPIDFHEVRNYVEQDFDITKVIGEDEIDENGDQAPVKVEGYCFNYDKSIFPISVNVTNPDQIHFFIDKLRDEGKLNERNEDGEEQPPFFTTFKARFEPTLTITVVQNAFGGTETEVKGSKYARQLAFTFMRNGYEDESTFTVEEWKEKLRAYELKKAEMKQKAEERAAQNPAAVNAFDALPAGVASNPFGTIPANATAGANLFEQN